MLISSWLGVNRSPFARGQIQLCTWNRHLRCRKPLPGLGEPYFFERSSRSAALSNFSSASNFFSLAVFVLKRLWAFTLGYLHAAVFGFPVIDGCLRYSVFAAQVSLTAPALPETVWFKLCGQCWRVQHGIVSFFCLGWRYVADGLQKAAVVEPIYPFQCCELHGPEVAPWSSPVDDLGLVKTDDRFGESVEAPISVNARKAGKRTECRDIGISL
ncbi:hypothetical protein C8J37_1403 [Rhizobium sp. PP-WC-1G-195]|nr:hypothetical protein C8J37_1403 [Rhizobium sp. PP-WC-1G-195]TCP73788.1 hypothetical protein C8J31_1563 [Rhizobium sp. PP-CC-2G-626]